MKKKLQEQLKQLAKDILDKKGFEDLEGLQEQVKMLYDTITVQLFLKHNGQNEKTSHPEKAMGSLSYKDRQTEEPVPVEQPTHKENLAEPLIEKIKDIVAQMPSETQKIDALLEELLLPKKDSGNELQDFASNYQQMPTFERKEPRKPIEKETAEEPQSAENKKKKSLNDRLVKDLKIGLNDRLAFTKHLFNNSVDDYNRVVSQITTLNNYSNAQQFIEDVVKPDYNWEGKELYVERFLLLVEKRFD